MSRWPTILGSCIWIAVVSVDLTLYSPSLAQPPAKEPAPSPQLPELPETKVIGEAQEGTASETAAPSPAISEPSFTPAPSVSQQPLSSQLAQSPIFGSGALGIPGRGESQLGRSDASSAGSIGLQDLKYKPILRPGEILENIPGVIVTQHSGSGKANQFFLRGFNLDHGTDFAAFLDGVPLNQRTHAHGQGYLDLNFLIPELVYGVDFQKGPYDARIGDFSSAGSASIRLVDRLPEGIARFEGGSFGHWRSLTAKSYDIGPGSLLFAVDVRMYDGPWVVGENLERFNGLLKYTVGDEDGGMTLSYLGYQSNWTSTDQIPLRSVLDGSLSRLGTIDPTDGGKTARHGFNGRAWHQWDNGGFTEANAYATYYRLDLWSNFTFFLDNPVQGDQIQQVDRRWTTGTNITHRMPDVIFDEDMWHTFGLQFRNDDIPTVALNRTVGRGFLSRVRQNNVTESSVGIFYRNEARWLQKFRTVSGIRGDFYWFDVADADIAANAGDETAAVASPKLSLIFGPWAKTELYLNGGYGFHSNDARGTTATIDPVSGDPLDPVPGIVQSRGSEFGIRTEAVPNLISTLSLWYLELDSELVYVGDAGTNEPNRASARKGIEYSNYYKINDWLWWYGDYSVSRARFTEFDPAGPFIPGAIQNVFGSGLTVRAENGLYGSLGLRFFGPRPLTEDNSVQSDSTTVMNMQVGYDVPRFRVAIDFLNLLDSKDQDIAYFYGSRLPGEPVGGVDDLHFHPIEPFGVRASLTLKW